MKKKMINNNQITVSGELVSEFSFDHEVFGEKFYTTKLSVERKSGNIDVLPVLISERIIDIKREWKGEMVKVYGQVRSYNKHEENKSRLILSVFVKQFENLADDEPLQSGDENSISLDGYICKPPIYRETPLGREIADILLAVNRPYGKSDYIPCICWGRNARFASGLEVGTRLQIEGRIQSREYRKQISDEECETRIAYEVSVSRLEVAEDEQSKD